jgi:solute carrier family 30 (zinc transporter), member 1
VSSLRLIVQWGLDMIYLVRSTSFILLQGVPPEVSLEDVRSGILAVEGVLSVHELHIWQLSETKIIASVHITASRELEFMPIASDIRGVLHKHGIHSSTIQPEYHPYRDAVLEERSKVRYSKKASSFVGLMLSLYSP